ncbi:MAG: DUF3857 and transglutaminase domain-containing protein [Acidobacteriia bacterium]|nr:DUF3857 and transglutaminase domain-containing protein [Terriglobia bacterium]
MRVLRPFVYIGCLLSCAVGWGQKTDWLPVTPRDLQIKEVPGNPGAPAIQLYYFQDIDDSAANNESERVYRRIKILTEKGNKYADVEIVVPPGCHVQEVKARTIHPDGKTIDFTGKPFDKVLVKGNGFKFMGKAFTLPEVTPGSIVEYRYKLDYPPNELPFHEWAVQHELYTVKEDFRIRAYTGRLVGEEGSGLSLSSHLPSSIRPQRKGEGFELTAQDVPPFEAEPFMPPEASYIYRVSFFYGGQELRTAETFWQHVGNRWNDQSEAFIGNRKEAREAATAAIGSATDPEKKLRALYARAQQIRNLSYERGRTEEEQKKESLKPNQNVADVLTRGYGYRDDITRTFIAMARAAGFTASLVRVSNRSERFFDKNTMSRRQLDAEIAQVSLNGRDVLLDPGTRFCPFGLLRWIRTSTKAMRVTKGGGEMFETPGAPQDQAVIERTTQASLDDDGALQAEIKVVYKGSEALERRLEATETDDAGRKKNLEDEVKKWLPPGAVAKVKEVKAWEGTEEPLEASFTVTVPSYASVAGKRLLVPVSLFQPRQKNAFKTQERKYPVYFPYAFAEDDTTTIKVPAGYSVETALQSHQASLPAAVYQNHVELSGAQLVSHRVLQVNGIYFRADQYSDVRNFFSQVQLGDEQQAVFQGGSVHAQKEN